MTETRISRATAAAKALAHPARLRVLSMLTTGPLCVCQMTAVLRIAPSTVSEHLRELKRAGLLVEERAGKFVSYRLASARDAGPWLRAARAAVAGDPVAESDARLVSSLRDIPVERFVASGHRLPARAVAV